MRTTEGKPALARHLNGDPVLAELLCGALSSTAFDDRATHGFHTYPAGLNPDAARDLLAMLPGQDVLDPFCGGGTVLVEGRIAGRQTIGLDLNPTALRVARMRTSSPDDEVLTRFRSTARKLTEVARLADDLPPQPILDAVAEWYAPCALYELESLRQGIALADPSVRKLLWGALSSILIKVSWRKSDTSARREKHKRPPGTTAILFHKKVRELARRMVDLRERVPEGTPETQLFEGDARRLSVRTPVDLVLTSPPYPATYDYLPMQHLRRIWLEDTWARDELELGARRSWRGGDKDARRRWRQDTVAWTRAVAKVLKPGGQLAIIIGDGRSPKGMVDAGTPTREAGETAGLELIASASIQREDHAHETTRWEHAFVFGKPT